ncbi:hypothetical protein A2291_07210 [candidate division WOR-1 bacterium RIFOXYB2_FULL_42_35]|uniref:PPM-type phosphatase domain-containing protein n=1 Tax=candidate division WOR-1 bacterium RIFOXYC2_FULL_41_25 TaxID=1802586 RepID=A0A1F4TKH9_UNCSA|nr:MAG: hypothetical protein A2247_04550 [candidate division WOR-1 bacterium RIFOXYA2_FULL_41_14]OGC22494.1 MAG: hypothetical protein A2291_07210 [candidate division WOR-1 bacterium RIFOXYB2_FULL_42_35]OGC33232.1 MAG: hypothetical protein A2462_07385 [candidate division WOR-1 bacterium RIFOXYC2_FULL_41_25]OGC42766.1 MAG: hypothetical protein A2548_07220 [candidate division WOR-1 bacterium RIFOXYD2_FULL_41_8]
MLIVTDAAILPIRPQVRQYLEQKGFPNTRRNRAIVARRFKGNALIATPKMLRLLAGETYARLALQRLGLLAPAGTIIMADEKIAESASKTSAVSTAIMGRKEQQDATIVFPNDKGGAVIDGMGGHSGGAIAARLAAQELAKIDTSINRETRLRKNIEKAIKAANQAIIDYIIEHAIEVLYREQGTIITKKDACKFLVAYNKFREAVALDPDLEPNEEAGMMLFLKQKGVPVDMGCCFALGIRLDNKLITYWNGDVRGYLKGSTSTIQLITLDHNFVVNSVWRGQNSARTATSWGIDEGEWEQRQTTPPFEADLFIQFAHTSGFTRMKTIGDSISTLLGPYNLRSEEPRFFESAETEIENGDTFILASDGYDKADILNRLMLLSGSAKDQVEALRQELPTQVQGHDNSTVYLQQF